MSGDELQSAVQSALEAIETNGVSDIARARWVGDLPTITAESVVSGLVPRSETPAADASAESDAQTSAE